MSLFLISALRAILEMLGLSLLGQGILHPIAGQKRESNRIYQLFSLITAPPRRIVARLLLRSENDLLIGILTFAIILVLWLGLAFLRKFV